MNKLATGYRARYFGPNGRRYKAPTLFLTKPDARSWLSLRQAEIIRKAWGPPEAHEQKPDPITFTEYAEHWLAERDLKDRTSEHYRKLLDQRLLQAPFASLPLASITSDDVRTWHAKFGTETPTMRAHCYGLLRTIMGTAASDGKIAVNPCVIRGAGNSRRVHKIRPAMLDELAIITQEMPAQSDAGIRDVSIPPHLLPALEGHLSKHVGVERDARLFPATQGGHLAPATLNRHFYKARGTANRPDLRFHDLRHSGAVLAGATGATLAELMGRLGHSTPAAAMRCQHAAQGRDREIAALLSKLADNKAL